MKFGEVAGPARLGQASIGGVIWEAQERGDGAR